MKKILLLFSLFFFFTSVTFALSVPADEQQDPEEKAPSQRELKKIEKQKADGTYYPTQLKLARKYYFEGDFDSAEDICDKIVIAQPDNEEAAELQNKIEYLKNKKVLYTRELIDGYYTELRKVAMEGNCYEGFLYVKKIALLSKDEKLDYFTNILTMEKNNILSRFHDPKSKKTFIKSLEAFVDEDFYKSTKLLYKLQEKYPQFAIYLSISRSKEFIEGTLRRKDIVYKRTLKELKNSDFVAAKNSAEMLFMMDYTDIKTRLLLDQIDLEIED